MVNKFGTYNDGLFDNSRSISHERVGYFTKLNKGQTADSQTYIHIDVALLKYVQHSGPRGPKWSYKMKELMVI